VGASPDVFDRVSSFFGTRIWDAHLPDLPRHRAAAYKVSRIAYSTARGFFDHGVTFRAAALTYFSVLSVVPFLASAFALLKGFGVYHSFVRGTLRPYLQDTFAANPALYDAMERILLFVDQTDVSRLGTLAVLFLLYTSVTLISNVEDALNDIFGAKAGRPFVRQLTDYTTLLVIAPILLVVATTLSAAAQSSRFVLFLRHTLALGPVIDFIVGVAPILVVGVALFSIYVILPNVRTRVTSALLGAAVAAVLWQGALVLHVQSQMGVARYNALYSGLGAIPIFLVWTYVSWIVVLVGAQIAASHQNEKETRQRFRARHVDQALREMLAVVLAARVARDFLDSVPRDGRALAELVEVPAPVVEAVLDDLVRAGVLVRAVFGRVLGYVPGRDIDELRAEDVRQAVRRDAHADDIRRAIARQLGPEMHRILRELEGGARRGAENRTLRELAVAVGDGRERPGAGGGPDVAVERGELEPTRAEVADSKQPDVPA
jgi:membrane protein